MKKFIELLFVKSLRGVGKATIYKKYWNVLSSSEGIEELATAIKQIDPKITDDMIEDAKEKRPLILYVKGDMDALSKPNIAVVGTRELSAWSSAVEERLVDRILELSDRVIVSGLAIGCDEVAHTATVNAEKPTIAVLPSGVNVITPASHKKLAAEIIDTGGCLVSEYDPSTKVSRATYIERDAIVAAFSDATYVIECKEDSGTMHTVDYAVEYGRKIACYYTDKPGRGDYSGNRLILNHKGGYKISDTDELKEFLGVLEGVSYEEDSPKAKKTASEEEPKQLTFEDWLMNMGN